MATQTNIKKHTAGAALIIAVLGSMSGLPGSDGVVQSTDLSSRSSVDLKHCHFENEIGEKGKSECRVVHKNKISADVTVEEVVRHNGRPLNPNTQVPPAPGTTVTKRYKVISKLEADFCSNGECSMEREVRTIEEAIDWAKKLSDKLAKDAKARQTLIDKCEIDEEDNKITQEPEILKCLTDKLKDMDPEQAAKYYAENLKDRIQGLLQSNSENDRAHGMGALAKLGKDMDINCQTRPGLNLNGRNSQNPYLVNRQNLLNPLMIPMRPPTTVGTQPGGERDAIIESTCDLWAFGSYNQNVEYLKTAAGDSNTDKKAIVETLKTLKNGWGTYFKQRGMVLNGDRLALSGLNSSLMTDQRENDEFLGSSVDESIKAIVAKHKDLLEPTPVRNEVLNRAGRGARGGVVLAPHNPTGPGTASVSPWPTSPAVPQARPATQVAPMQRGAVIAPRMGTPVGAPGAPPLRP